MINNNKYKSQNKNYPPLCGNRITFYQKSGKLERK